MELRSQQARSAILHDMIGQTSARPRDALGSQSLIKPSVDKRRLGEYTLHMRRETATSLCRHCCKLSVCMFRMRRRARRARQNGMRPLASPP